MRATPPIITILISVVITIPSVNGATPAPRTPPTEMQARGVCPPFPLRDEQGAVIDPVKGINATVPYSPRQTCAASGCHDYDRITRGFHFTQGKGEAVPPTMAERYRWVSSPGNYGGNWCSPAPLYRQLAPEHNLSARTIDMTSFEFVTATCGNCHPGGGPLELDRKGRRYDRFMSDPASGLSPGGDNGLSGDYYKARWSETGVIEADCLLCHMPEYDLKKRNAELANLNFRWAASAGAGFATVTGKVSTGERPIVVYDPTKFDAEANVLVHIAPEPRNETCLGCHLKPDWKKRGAAYSSRTDVHLKAGLRCVDCHAAGSRAVDSRIHGWEEHQFGKGDDPSGWVRNDLDDTVRSCESCHLNGWFAAPRASHAWLPPLHLEKISCQACHIPQRAVKSALVQASDTYNDAPRITPPGKHIWTFYDQDMRFWNHYGELDLFTGKDEPTDFSRPTLILYKGKIYPANRVHSTWVGIEEPGKPGLDQLFMKDFFTMWQQHRKDPEHVWPQLAAIHDDNGDGKLEVNRPEEIDALLAATRAYLESTGFPLAGRRLVFVSDDRVYTSGHESRLLAHESYEATPYASVYKFSHDVVPARAALGAGGCTDCHARNASFFAGRVLGEPFSGAGAAPRWITNASILGISPAIVRLGALREEWGKPTLYALCGLWALALVGWAVRLGARSWVQMTDDTARRAGALAFLAGAGVFAVTAASPGLLAYMTARRFALDANHFALAAAIVAGAAIIGAARWREWRASHLGRWASTVLASTCLLAAVAGLAMVTRLASIGTFGRLAYTAFDAALLVVVAAAVVLTLVATLARGPSQKV